MKQLSKYFMQGLLFTVPVALTVYVVFFIFVKIDRLLGLSVPGLGLLVTVAAITFIGFVASNFLIGKLLRLIESAFVRLPLIRMIYTSIKDLIGAFVGDKKNFDKPVIVTLCEKDNIQALGFMTSENLDALSVSERVAVYLPQSYNFAGNLIVVSPAQVTLIETDPGEVMKFIISGGVSSVRA